MLWNPRSEAAPGKFHRSTGHSECNRLKDEAKFHRSHAWEIIIIFNTVITWSILLLQQFSSYHNEPICSLNIVLYYKWMVQIPRTNFRFIEFSGWTFSSFRYLHCHKAQIDVRSHTENQCLQHLPNNNFYSPRQPLLLISTSFYELF